MKRVFIDLDGTLIDSSQRHIAVLRKVLDNSRYKCETLDDFVTYKAYGNTTCDYLINKLDLEEEEAKRISKLWVKNIEDEEFQKIDSLYEDSYFFLNEIKKRGWSISAITAREKDKVVRKTFHNLKLDDYIDKLVIVSPTMAIQEKTNYLLISSKSQDVYIGDTEVDYFSAQNSNIKFFALNRGFRNKTYWSKYSIRTYSGLIEVLDELL